MSIRVVDPACKNPGCGGAVRSNGLCARCHNRSLKIEEHGPPGRLRQPAKGRTCTAPDCERPVRCRGLCARHYDRLLRYRQKNECPGCGAEKQKVAELCAACRSAKYAGPPEATERECPSCHLLLPIDDFPWRVHQTGWKRRSDCRRCEAKRSRNYRNRLSPEERKRRSAASYAAEKARLAADPDWKIRKQLRSACRTLGLPFEEVLAAWEAHGRTCDICHKPAEDEKGRRLAIDHDHETGEFRGFLCGSCNTGMGLLSDDPARLRAAADYLERRTSEFWGAP